MAVALDLKFQPVDFVWQGLLYVFFDILFFSDLDQPYRSLGEETSSDFVAPKRT